MEITRYTIQAQIPKPVRFAFVSDLHDTANEPILKALEQERPHGILGGGDYIHNNTVYQRGFDFLRTASERWPVICSLGNHEKRFRRNIRQAIEETGAILLDNSFMEFQGICIGGLTSGWAGKIELLEQTPPPQLDWLQEYYQQPGFKLLLNHHPEYYLPYLKEGKADLILSGHAHGGQWRFFGRGVLAPGQGLFPKFTAGIHEERLIISRGLGNFHKIPRLFNPPELVILDLI